MRQRPSRHHSWSALLLLGGVSLGLAALRAPAMLAQGPAEITPSAAGVTASAHDGNVPANAVDNSSATRWSASGDGQWIQFDLGATRRVGAVAIAVHNGNARRALFDLQVSTGGGVWTTVFSGESSGTTLAEELYDFADVDARWVRYLGHGNSVNAWNSLTEVSLFAGETGGTDIELTPLAAAVTASADDGNVPGNAVDKNLGTRWSASGDGQWLQLDLGSAKTVKSLRAAFYNGNTRRSLFDIQISNGGGVWTTIFSGQGSGTSTALETFDVPDTPARWVRYLGHGNSTNAWNSVTEIEVWGADCPGCPPPCSIPTGNSTLWANFVQAKQNGTEPTLPDFSYAGYRRSDTPIPTVTGPIFNVTSYGATPNDASYDEAGIQAAIDAAATAGGGIVFLPAGQYLVSPSETATATVRITSSHIVLRGAGSGAGGTEVVMVNKRQGTTMFEVEPAVWTPVTVANVTANVRRETFSVTVDTTAALQVGQWVVIKYQNPEYNSFYFDGLPLAPEWTRVVNDGVNIHEVHQIAHIAGSTVTFREPVHYNLRMGTEPHRLDRIQPLEEVGIEDIRFTGKWDTYPETFVHHKDWIHDSGWTMLSVKQVSNAWVRRVEFRHVNQAIHTDTASFITFDNVKYTGKKGHTSITHRRGYGVLVSDNEDTASFHHGPGGGYQAVNTVYLRHRMQSGQSVDWHGGGVHASLLDAISGGRLAGNGGPHDNYPHHGRYMVFWNFVHRGSGASYDFWSLPRNSNTFAKPLFAGFTSDATVTFQSPGTEVGANESQGTPVTPASLFAAQLQLRQCP